MQVTRGIIFKSAIIAIFLLGPLVVGSIPFSSSWPFFICSGAITLYALSFNSLWAKRVVLALVSVALTITILDLGLRIFAPLPDELLEKWPRMPLVNRYIPNLNYQGNRFNDLSRMAGVKEWREEKEVKVITDAAGFRNERFDQSRLDVILLGDSFGGGAVSQEDTWTSILTREYHLNSYNLSSPASGPWHEYVNLWAEKERLKANPGANLIWQLFTGNDLDDQYRSLELSELPWSGQSKAWINKLNAKRARSPIRSLLERGSNKDAVLASDFLNDRKLLFYKPYLQVSSRSREEIIRHPNYGSLRAVIIAVKTLAEARGFRLSIVMVPTKEEVYSWVWKGTSPWSTELEASGFAVALSDICAEQKLRCLDLKSAFVSESKHAYENSGQLLYWYDDTHLNPTGNRLSVSIIYNELLGTTKHH